MNFNRFYLKTIPEIVQLIVPGLTWKKKTSEHIIYLTFDDGPHPESTPVLLEILQELKIKASFFCLGEQVEKHPGLFNEIITSGHTAGNHGYTHMDGWKCKPSEYVANVFKAEKLIPSSLYRPPYGRIKRSQIRELRKKFEIVMWDVMPGDFDTKISEADLFLNMTRGSKKGSIVVLHDTPQTIKKLTKILPRYSQFMNARGYSFEALYSVNH